MSKLVRVLAAASCWLAVLPCGARPAIPPTSGSAAQSHYERPGTKGGLYKERVVVFVHGIFGNSDSTWRYSPRVYWPRLLLTDEAFRDSDVYVASYTSSYLGNTMTVDEVVANLNNRLISDGIFSKHREVVFVCHSLGGLVVQRLLLTFREHAQQVPFIYFFSTPETGAQVANLGGVFSSDPLLKVMFAGDENGYLENLENEWKAAKFHIHRFCAFEKKKYKGVLVVDRLSSTRNCDDPPIAINEDHLGIVKPNSTQHDSYIALRDAALANPISRKLATPVVPSPPRITPVTVPVGTVRKDAIALGNEIHKWIDEQINSRDKQQKKDEDTEALAARFGLQSGKDYQGKFGLKIAKMLAKLRKCEADVSKLEAAVSDSNASPTFRIPEVLYSVVSALPEAANSIPDGKPECGTGAPSEGFKRKHTGRFTVVSGDNSSGFWEEQLESGIELPEGGLSKFKFYEAAEGVIYVDATLYLVGGGSQSSGTIGEPDVVIRKNQVTISQMLPLWDEQVSDDTIEIVNNNRVAVFRLVFDRNANKVTINAVYRNEAGPIGNVKGFKPIFKYPSHFYKGEIAN
jgi:pimeloyl-ACP methyl ester carboxylesterase